MQKFLAIFVVLAFVATGAFAVDVSAGGRVGFAFQGDNHELDKDNDEKREVTTDWTDYFWVNFRATNGENTAGASASISAESSADGNNIPSYNGDKVEGPFAGLVRVDWMYAWWRPIPQLYLLTGKIDEPGQYWHGPNITGWGFMSNDVQDMMLSNANYNDPMIFPESWGGSADGGTFYYASKYFGWWNNFPGGALGSDLGKAPYGPMHNRYGFQASILPIDGMHVSLAWDFPAGKTIGQALIDTFRIQAAYSIPGAGTASVTFVNDGDETNDSDGNPKGGFMRWGYRYLAVNYSQDLGGMSIEGAVSMALPVDSDEDMPGMLVSLGYCYGSPWGDQFWASARLGAYIGMRDEEPTIIGFEVCPSYDLGIFRAYMPVGFSMVMPNVTDADNDTWFAWAVSPYIKKDIGVISMWTGITLWNDGASKDSVMFWKVPFVFQFSL